jgi:hypothetical protein
MPALRVLTELIGASTSHAPGPAAFLDAPAAPATLVPETSRGESR